MFGGSPVLDWVVFAASVVLVMAVDHFAFGRAAREMRFREAAIRSSLFGGAALLFAAFVFARRGRDAGADFVVAYLVEQSLSVDNLFVFLVVFSYFRVPQARQQRVLFWGIVGAVLMRAVFVVLGAEVLKRFTWAIYPFGLFLVWTGIKLGFKGDDDDDAVDPGQSSVLRLAKKYLRTTDGYEGDLFFVTRDGLRYATRLFLVLLVVEFTDVLFAVDSVPAVLAITSDLFVVYTSNIFAILGLRALFFLLAGMMSRFRYLDVGLAFVLVFIGVKMLVSQKLHVPSLVSLGVIVLILAVSITLSILRPEPSEGGEAGENREGGGADEGGEGGEGPAGRG